MFKRVHCAVIAFKTTHDAMAMEEFAKANNIAGRLIPLPSVISAGCGMAWAMPVEKKDELLGNEGFSKMAIDGIYEMLVVL